MLERLKKENIAIKFDSVEEQKEFLKIAEKENYKWSQGEKPMSFIPMNIHANNTNIIYSGYYKTLFWGNLINWSIITWQDYKASLVDKK